MHPRAQAIIALLQLEAHPEGGRYRRAFCSTEVVQRIPTGEQRPALTSIFYLLIAGETSDWHRVASDEAWHHYEGAAVELCVCSPHGEDVTIHMLGPLSAQCSPLQVVPAHHWQRARPLGDYSLVGCSVGPGFDFADFSLARDLDLQHTALRERLCGRQDPQD